MTLPTADSKTPRRPRFLEREANDNVVAARFSPVSPPTPAPPSPTPARSPAPVAAEPAPPTPPPEAPEPEPAAPHVPPDELLAALADTGAVHGRPCDHLERVAVAVDKLRLESRRLAEEARSDALEIGFLVARKILEAEVSAGTASLFALIRSAIRRAGDTRIVEVRLCPSDVDLVRNAAASGDASDLSLAQVTVTADADLERGDCVVVTDFGTVDGRLETRLDELRRAVGAAREGVGR